MTGKPKVTGREREKVPDGRGWSLSRPLAVLFGGFVIGAMSPVLRPSNSYSQCPKMRLKSKPVG